MSILVVDNVTKRYNKTVAVNRVSFEVTQGRLLGLLGPNGAGKTSTIRMITYITIPDEGQIRFQNQAIGPWSQEKMGYMPEERGLYRKMKIGEQLTYLAELKGLSKTEAKQRIHYWMERFEATAWLSKKTEELSKGMQQKVQFVATIVHDPELLIFDEPFSGLDPINSELLREVIVELKEQGKTILFSSHRMEQVEQMCDDICLISNGQVVLSGDLRKVKKSFGRNTVLLEFEGNATFLKDIKAKTGGELLSHTQNRAEIKVQHETQAQQILSFAKEQTTLYHFELLEPSLNEIFINAVSEKN